MNRTRPKQIVIRVSEEELAQIKEKVEQSGKSQQQYIIEALTQSNIVNTDGIKELIPELKRVGNNLNQIAHALNGSSYYSYNLITENQRENVIVILAGYNERMKVFMKRNEGLKSRIPY